MSTVKTSGRLIGAGVFSAIAASLCCITPVLALIAGSTGMAASFSWLEPVRPYLVGVTLLVLGFAWWQNLKPKTKEEIDCACDTNEKQSFWQSKKFLGLVTAFAALMLTFPSYAHVFYPGTRPNTVLVQPSNVQKADFQITGMTCTGCEEHVEHTVSQIPGFIKVTASYEEGTASVKFDKSKSPIEDVVKAINETGYTVADYKIRE